MRSVAEEAIKTPFTELKRQDLAWETMEWTSVESQIFYLFSDTGRIAFVQVIYNSVAGLRTTWQLTSKILSPDPAKPHLWCSSPLVDVTLSEDKTSFYGDGCAVELSEDGTFYTVKSVNDERAIINLKISRSCPGIQIGTSGTTLFGTDLENPWGRMRHAFWPRCVAEGTICTDEGALDFKGRAVFIHALQGMKPHHAAARWNFATFQGLTHSAVMMEFTTPVSYGTTTVNVGCVTKDGEILAAGCQNAAKHLSSKKDADNEWPEPTVARFSWSGADSEGREVEGVIEGPLGDRVDRIDIMSEVPMFIRSIIAGAAGTKPYIYQFRPSLPLKLKIGDEHNTHEGTFYVEATFISEAPPPDNA